MTRIEILGHSDRYALNGMYHDIADEEVQDIITFSVYDHNSSSRWHPQYKRLESHPSTPSMPRYAFIGCA